MKFLVPINLFPVNLEDISISLKKFYRFGSVYVLLYVYSEQKK